MNDKPPVLPRPPRLPGLNCDCIMPSDDVTRDQRPEKVDRMTTPLRPPGPRLNLSKASVTHYHPEPSLNRPQPQVSIETKYAPISDKDAFVYKSLEEQLAIEQKRMEDFEKYGTRYDYFGDDLYRDSEGRVRRRTTIISLTSWEPPQKREFDLIKWARIFLFLLTLVVVSLAITPPIGALVAILTLGIPETWFAAHKKTS